MDGETRRWEGRVRGEEEEDSRRGREARMRRGRKECENTREGREHHLSFLPLTQLHHFITARTLMTVKSVHR